MQDDFPACSTSVACVRYLSQKKFSTLFPYISLFVKDKIIQSFFDILLIEAHSAPRDATQLGLAPSSPKTTADPSFSTVAIWREALGSQDDLQPTKHFRPVQPLNCESSARSSGFLPSINDLEGRRAKAGPHYETTRRTAAPRMASFLRELSARLASGNGKTSI